jgi:hypothetical protein
MIFKKNQGAIVSSASISVMKQKNASLYFERCPNKEESLAPFADRWLEVGDCRFNLTEAITLVGR